MVLGPINIVLETSSWTMGALERASWRRGHLSQDLKEN